jgi:pSer/pThr/pTyr-binding forkhead associated (FHA) protein
LPLTLTVRSGAKQPDLTHAAAGDSAVESSVPGALTFDGPRVVIGRGASCDVRLPDPSVSHRHATIRVDDGRHALVDEGSTNGTFVGGVRLARGTPRILRTGDLVRIGRVWLEVRIDQTPATRDLAMATRDLALMLVSQAMEALGDDVVPKVRVVEGPDAGATLPLFEEGRVYVIGRGESCDLSLADADASREHVQVVRRGQTVLVRDLGSKNGALMGEARLATARDVAWKSTVVLRVARTVLALEEPALLALGALEEAADEPMDDADAAPPPPVSAARAREHAPANAAPASAAASVAGGGSAPIAEVVPSTKTSAEERATGAPRRTRSGWSATDSAVVLAALAVIALSVAGLVWLLKT